MAKHWDSFLSYCTLLTSPIKDDVGPLDHDNEEDYANLMDTAELTRRLMNKNTKPLQFVCEDLEAKPPERFRNSTMMRKKDWVAALVEWVSWPSRHCSLADQKTQRMTKPTRPVHLRPAKIGTPEVMQTVRDVISQTTVPSWVSSVPQNFGDPTAGTLKADEWCTLITIYLPIALIFAWGELASHPSSYVSTRLHEVLENTMLLISTIVIACKCNMSKYCCQAYCYNFILCLPYLDRPHFFSYEPPMSSWHHYDIALHYDLIPTPLWHHTPPMTSPLHHYDLISYLWPHFTPLWHHHQNTINTPWYCSCNLTCSYLVTW